MNKEYFTQEKTAFHCERKEDAEWLMGVLHRYGLAWGSGSGVKVPTCWYPYKEMTCYRIKKYEGRIVHANYGFYQEEGYKIINVKELREKEMKQDNLTQEQKGIIKEAFCQVTEIDTKEKMQDQFPFLKKKVLPKTYKEYCKITNRIHDSLRWESDKYSSLKALILLRDYYRDGWKPDWENDSFKYIVCLRKSEWGLYNLSSYNKMFSLQSEGIAKEFLRNFKDNLLEGIKPLFS